MKSGPVMPWPAVEAGAAMPGGAEHHLLLGDAHIRHEFVIRRVKRGEVDEIGFLGGLAGACVHAPSLSSGGLLVRVSSHNSGNICGARRLAPHHKADSPPSLTPQELCPGVSQ
jgi:hypothetical protein